MEDQPGLFDGLPFDQAAPAGGPGARRLLLASAGTGKTYQLAGQFAALLVLGEAPERILATTFTRKAAGEILDRVLGKLADAAEDDERGRRAREHVAHVAAELEPERAAGELTPAHCRAVLAGLLRAIGRFQVRTLDAFFVRIAGLFSDQLAIAPGWRITGQVEERALVLESVARLLEDEGLGDEQQFELVRALARTAGARKAAEAVAEVVEDADELGRRAESGAWRRVEPLPRPDEGEVAAAIRTVVDLDLPTNDKGKVNGHWRNAHAPLCALLGDFREERDLAQLADLLDKGLAKAALGAEPKFYNVDLPEHLVAALRVLHALVAHHMVEDLRARNLATEGLLERYRGRERGLRAELSAWRFSDFTDALLEGPARADSDTWRRDLAYRLDGRIDHLLLDEFQDTAPHQWRLLEPLAAEILAGGTELRSFFCVGDVKQSIYGWRGGEPRLLARMGERYPALTAETLQESYRSSPVVLEAVNRVFTGIADRAVLLRDKHEFLRSAAEEWSASFAAHGAARAELAGAARLWLAPAVRPGDRDNDAAVRFAVERIAELHARHPGASIGVLLRAKRDLPRIRYELGKRGIEASDEGGNPLTDTPAVTWMLALLHLADHPADGVARLQLVRSPLAGALGLDEHPVESEEGALAAGRAARRLRAEFTHRGLGAFVERWASAMAEGLAPWDARRLEQFVELALAADGAASPRPTDFAEHVRATAVPDPTGGRVKVMTIHASKGLEFDVVVLPDLGRRANLQPPEVLADSADETAPPRLLTVRPRKELLPHHAQLEALHGQAQQRSMTDALSTLYVAMTRAVHTLEVVVPREKAAGKGHMALCDLFVPELVAEGGADQGEGAEPVLAWEQPGSSDEWAVGDAVDDAGGFVDERPLSLQAAPADAGVLRPSGDGPTHDREASRLGTLVHALLAGVEWLAPGGGDPRHDARLAALCRRVDPRPGAPVDEAVALFRRALAAPELAELLASPAGRDGVAHRVLTERTFDVECTDLDGGPRRMRGALDRLVLTLEGDRVREAEVIDFKVVERVPGDAALVARHGPQLEAYRAAVAELYGIGDAQRIFLTLGVIARDGTCLGLRIP